MSRGFIIIYAVASASWLTSIFVSPALGALLGAFASWGFWRMAQGFGAWNRQRRHISYELATLASRGAAVASALTSIAVASWLASAPVPSLDAWAARLLLYVAWTGLWILYYYVIQVRLEEDLGVERPLDRYHLTFTALGLSILLSPLLTEGLPVPPETKLPLAASLYAGYLPPLNASALLAARLAR